MIKTVKGFGENVVTVAKLDPITILMVISIIIELFKIWRSCKKKDEDLHFIFKKPSIIDRFLIRKVIKKHTNDSTLRIQLEKTLTEEVAKLSKEEVECLIKDGYSQL